MGTRPLLLIVGALLTTLVVLAVFRFDGAPDDGPSPPSAVAAADDGSSGVVAPALEPARPDQIERTERERSMDAAETAAPEADAAAPRPSPDRETTTPYFGRIVRDLEGTPIVGATVTLRGRGESTTTDLDGRFTIGLRERTGRTGIRLNPQLFITATDRAPRVVTPADGHDRPDDPEEIRMTGGATLRVVLDDRRPEIGARTVDAWVYARDLDRTRSIWDGLDDRSPTESLRAPVDEHGRCVFGDLPPDAALHLTISEGETCVGSLREPVVLRPDETRELRWILGADAVVTGTLVRDDDGRPLPGREVSILERPPSRRPSPPRDLQDAYHGLVTKTKTDRHGRFRFDGVPPGAYWIGARARYPMAVQPFDVVVERPHVEVTVAAPELLIEGTVKTADGRTPSYFRVHARSTSLETVFSGRANRDGTFSIGPLWPETYRVWASSHGADAPSEETVASAGTAGLELRLRRGASVSGRVLRGAGGESVPATVFLTREDSDGAASTYDRDAGSYSFEGLEPGTYHLAATTESGLVGIGPSVTVQTGEALTGVEITVEPAASLELSVDADAPVWNVYVHAGTACVAYDMLRPGANRPVVAPADVDLTVRVTAWYDEQVRTVRLAPGEHRKLEFTFRDD